MTDVIRVVILAKSPLIRCLISSFLSQESDIKVVGATEQEEQALVLIESLKPHVIALPLCDGLGILDHIMHKFPTPIVATYTSKEDLEIRNQAQELGAVDFIYFNDTNPNEMKSLQWEFIEKIHTASRVRVIRSLRSRRDSEQNKSKNNISMALDKRASSAEDALEKLIVIGASTGGPTALRSMLKIIPSGFSSTILIVQHMPEGYTAALASQLNNCTSINVSEAENGSLLEHSSALVAPGDWHLILDSDFRVRLTRDPAVGGHRPSVDVTMKSAAEIYGRQAIGVILTGMGCDGAMGLRAIHSRGGKTFAQESKSCVVDGMPKCARESGVVDFTATPVEIAQQLISIQE